MRKPTLEEFYDETTGSYDYEEYCDVMGNYEDEQRDLQIEREMEEKEEYNSNKGEKR